MTRPEKSFGDFWALHLIIEATLNFSYQLLLGIRTIVSIFEICRTGIGKSINYFLLM